MSSRNKQSHDIEYEGSDFVKQGEDAVSGPLEYLFDMLSELSRIASSIGEQAIADTLRKIVEQRSATDLVIEKRLAN